MDIIGISGVAAEAELLSAIALFLERVGLTSEDVVIKVSSRKVLQAVLQQYGVTADSFGPVCVVVDKLDKLPAEKVICLITLPLQAVLYSALHERHPYILTNLS